MRRKKEKQNLKSVVSISSVARADEWERLRLLLLLDHSSNWNLSFRKKNEEKEVSFGSVLIASALIARAPVGAKRTHCSAVASDFSLPFFMRPVNIPLPSLWPAE